MSPQKRRRTKHLQGRPPLPGPRVLSVRQPWAWAIVSGLKPVENRSWSTRYRGRLLIHAGTAIDPYGIQWFVKQRISLPSPLPRGAIVGSCDLVAIVDRRLGKGYGKWFFGPIGWVVNNAHELAKPVAMKGALGLFRPPAAVLRRIKAVR